MNSVNLVGWVLHTCRQNVLWNLVCYPLLSYSPSTSFSCPPPPWIFTVCYLLFWSILLPASSIYLTLCVLYLSLLHLFFPRSNVWSLKWNRQRLGRGLPAVLKSTQLPPTVASLLPLSPPSRHPQFTHSTEMLIHRQDSACNINRTPYQEQKRRLHTYTFNSTVPVLEQIDFHS